MPALTLAEKKQVRLIDVAIPRDNPIEEEQLGKVTKYTDLEI